MSHRAAAASIPLWWLIVVALVFSTPVARAGSGTQFSLPAAGVKNKSGLRLVVDGRGIDGNGYRPIHLEISPWPPKPLTADRQIRVVLKPRTYNAMSTPDASQVIDLPEGSTTVSATVLVPQSSLWYSLGIESFEGGEKLEDLSHPYLTWPNATGYWEWTESRPTMLFIDANVPPRAIRDPAVQSFKTAAADPTPTHDLPDVRQLIWLFPDPNRSAPGTTPVTTQLAGAPPATDNLILSQIADQARMEMLPPAELPKRWIELSQFDLILISLADLELLQTTHPPELDAIRNWLYGGPLLIVYGAGDKFERLNRIEAALQLPALPVDGDAAPEHRGWKKPDVKDQGELKNQNQWAINGGYMRRGNLKPFQPRPIAKPAANTDAPSNSQPAAPAKAIANSGSPPFVLRSAGQGCVVAIASEDPFPGKEADWVWVLNSVHDRHWRWYQRAGFSMHRDNDDYWKFLIPGVGRAPVVSFLVLVSLFAIVIGPVNYVLLGRARRLYLLLLTVPTGAALITVCLFAYALVSDGLGVRLRLRSFTELDQPAGRAAVWSRQTYYAAIAPSQGLIFPDDATVFPIVNEPGRHRTNQQNNDKLVVWDKEQFLRSGYLASRTTTQFMVQRVTPNDAKLVVREGQATGQPPQVENRLQTAIQYLLLRDSRGDYFSSQSLASEGSAKFAPVDLASAEGVLHKLADAVEPEYPQKNWDTSLHKNALGFLGGPNYGWMGVDNSASPPDMLASLLESSIDAAIQPTRNPLMPGTYIAIVNRSPSVPIGVPRAREEASLHVIRGRYSFPVSSSPTLNIEP